MVAMGTAQAWSEAAFEETGANPLAEAPWKEVLTNLREAALIKIIKAGPMDVRASAAAPKSTGEPGRVLFEAMKKAT
jgi:hypothetical protein